MPSLAFLPVVALRPPRLIRRPRRAVVRRRPICVAKEEQTPLPSQLPHIPESSESSESPEQRKERARKARIEAERLELMAAKARLEFERAELKADRKRLELDKAKNMKDMAGTKEHVGEPNPYDRKNSSPQVVNVVKQGKSQGLQPLTTTLSDLLGSEFPRVSESDINVIRDKLCGINTFFCTEVDRSPFDERVVFRGNMRQPADKLLATLEDMAKEEGIAERIRLFLLIDPKDGPDGEDNRPVLVALPAAAMPNQTNSFSYVVSVLMGLVACATTFSYGIGIFGLTPEVITQIAKGSLDEAILTLPVSIGAIILAFMHEAGHRVAASMRDVKIGLPYFIPSLQIGTYGTITPLESYPNLRKDLFDVAVAGPLVGSVASISALIAGLLITSSGQIADWFPQVPSALFHASILVGSLADIILPAGLREQATIAVHPLAVVGYTGLLANALNLMPIGRLDGGRIMQALYGRAVASRATAITLLLQGFSSLLGNSPLLLFWGLVAVFLQRESDYPCRNEVLEPDGTRTAIGVGAICLMLLVLIPFPDQLADILGRL
ncbi:unnamed protein product [Chondrus crispus]|uniref:Peptidase M50 domain-containing protein n=1 Tax=Chondrus crispus TaxID=2769 RepID=R7Q4W8_CHOCR|nr:unnamed protein product [Chondrus crispus]CDF32416.1 unnamed protein product [Chondrus crispus]|eukprot:XP_005712081.1 unnamed protein product [Chondrus crispus]